MTTSDMAELTHPVGRGKPILGADGIIKAALLSVTADLPYHTLAGHAKHSCNMMLVVMTAGQWARSAVGAEAGRAPRQGGACHEAARGHTRGRCNNVSGNAWLALIRTPLWEPHVLQFVT